MPSRLEDCTSGWLALFLSMAINIQMTQGWTHVWLIGQRPRQSLLGPGLCLHHRCQGTPAPQGQPEDVGAIST